MRGCNQLRVLEVISGKEAVVKTEVRREDGEIQSFL